MRCLGHFVRIAAHEWDSRVKLGLESPSDCAHLNGH